VIGLTTGRQSNQRLNSLLKELAHAIPRARIVRRGKSSLDDLGRRLFDEGIEWVLVLQRWHGGPGRIDFLKVGANSPAQLPPSMLLKAVKLRREYSQHVNRAAQAITCDPQVSMATRRFAHHLSQVLDLPESALPVSPEIKSSFHISEIGGGSLLLTVTSPPAEKDVGPRLVVSRLIWDLNA
jgi:rRNA maturation protein Rpf1